MKENYFLETAKPICAKGHKKLSVAIMELSATDIESIFAELDPFFSNELKADTYDQYIFYYMNDDHV